MTYNTLQQQSLHYFRRPHNGIPQRLPSPVRAWQESQLASQPDRRRYMLSPTEIDELHKAVTNALNSGKSLSQMAREDFPLSTLQHAIETWKQVIFGGLCFQMIRGIPVNRWSEHQLKCFFWGFGQHLGVSGAQNRDHELLGHVRDDGADENDPTVRQYRTSTHITHHCDAADIVGLLCLKQAKQGGISRIINSVSVYNELLKRRPDLVSELFKLFQLDA